MKRLENVNWIQLAHDTVQQCVLVYMAMHVLFLSSAKVQHVWSGISNPPVFSWRANNKVFTFTVSQRLSAFQSVSV